MATRSAMHPWRRRLGYLLLSLDVVWTVYIAVSLIPILFGGPIEIGGDGDTVLLDPFPDAVELSFLWGVLAIPLGLVAWWLLSASRPALGWALIALAGGWSGYVALIFLPFLQGSADLAEAGVNGFLLTIGVWLAIAVPLVVVGVRLAARRIE